MSKKHIEKNLKLSSSFNTYVTKHPEILKDITSSACIVMGSSDSTYLTNKNKEIAQKIVKKEKKKCYQAIRINRSWKINPIKA